jgi:flavodoxin
LAEEMKSVQFSGKWAAFIGLGDRRYEPVMFCEGMEKLRRLWLKNQGQELQEPLKINGEPYGLLDSTVMPWSAKLAASFESSSVQPSLVMRIKKWLSHD